MDSPSLVCYPEIVIHQRRSSGGLYGPKTKIPHLMWINLNIVMYFRSDHFLPKADG